MDESIKEKENAGPEASTEERAQFAVFRDGTLSREVIGSWIKKDLQAIASFVHGTMSDPEIFNAVVEAYYQRYLKLHANKQKNDKS